MTADAVTIRGLSVSYDAVEVLTDVHLRVPAGQVLALLGSSGSGKTTLLHTVAGFIRPVTGEVVLGDRLVAGAGAWVAPEHRDVGVVFQGAALWPHLTVLDTVAYPFRRRGVSREQARLEAAALLERVGLSSLLARLPAQLSGGEQQRVGLARALARSAKVFLFDEPTAHLDTPLRAVVLEEIAQRRERLGAAAIYATHNAAEALSIADQVAVLRAGRVIQVGTPEDLYDRPADADIARLTGPASLLAATPPTVTMAGAPDGEQQVLVRPDWVSFGGSLTGRIESVRYRGPHTDYLVSVPGGTVLVTSAGRPDRPPGSEVGLTISRTWALPGSKHP